VGLGAPSNRTRVRRAPNKARYDADAVHAIIDATRFCHVGVQLVGSGEVVVLPFLHARRGDTVILHGSRSNRLLTSMLAAPRVCATFTTFDGIRVARTGFHSSVSYRSVVAFGPVRALDDRTERAEALDAMVDAMLPGRSHEIRQPNERELALTTVVAMTIEDASAKVSEGPTEDEPEDLDSHVWAGDVPAAVCFGEPVGATDGAMATGAVPVPDSVRRLARP
jgi:nitroimidazol reductase NimA-like FMN-containing flavoprotein (pyridoxamine 5'-phosphate oxidase superfamily)